MYLLGEQPAYADAWVNRLQSIAGQLLQDLPQCLPKRELEPGDDLAQLLDEACVYWVESGLIKASLNERALFYLQDGDLLGLHQGHELYAKPRLSAEAPVSLVPYARAELLAHLSASAERQALLIEYLQGQTLLLCDAITRLKQPEFRSSNGFKRVAAGETLIAQGDDADHVFIITDGHAEAFVDGHKVGDVPKDEIFGAMAVFTSEKRSATVIASVPCTVMLIPKDQFLSLTQSNPRIAHSLIESMARRIESLNRQVTQQRNEG